MRKVKGYVTGVVTYYKTLLPTLIKQVDLQRTTTVVFASAQGGREHHADIHRAAFARLSPASRSSDYVTGEAAVEDHDFSTTSDYRDLRRAEVITFSLVLVLLLLTFGTVVSAILPLLLAGAAVVVGGNALIYLIGRTTDTSVFALNVASMIGLGLAIDFSLIVVSRFREELAKRGDAASALEATLATAGRSILYSGVTVMLGMVVLSVLVDLMVIRSISIGVLVVAAVALLAGLTLLPAVLALLGPRVERWRVLPNRSPKPESEGFWYALDARGSCRRPWAWLGASLAVIVLLALPATGLKMLGSTAKLLPQSAESVKGLNIINKQFGKNALSPIQIVLKTPKSGVFTPKFLTGLDTLTGLRSQADRRATGVTSLASYPMAAEPPRYDAGRYLAPEAGMGLLAGAQLLEPRQELSRRPRSS